MTRKNKHSRRKRKSIYLALKQNQLRPYDAVSQEIRDKILAALKDGGKTLTTLVRDIGWGEEFAWEINYELHQLMLLGKVFIAANPTFESWVFCRMR